MKLIDEAGETWHRLWSVRMSIIGVVYASVGGVYLAMPEGLRPDIPEWGKLLLAAVGVMLAASPGIARVIPQPKLAADKQVRHSADQAGA